jgi:hypothetical protein
VNESKWKWSGVEWSAVEWSPFNVLPISENSFVVQRKRNQWSNQWDLMSSLVAICDSINNTVQYINWLKWILIIGPMDISIIRSISFYSTAAVLACCIWYTRERQMESERETSNSIVRYGIVLNDTVSSIPECSLINTSRNGREMRWCDVIWYDSKLHSTLM